MQNPHAETIEFGARHYLSIFTILSLLGFSVFAAFDLKLADELTLRIRDIVLAEFDWLFVFTVTLVLVSTIALIAHPGAAMKLGKDDEVPEFSRLSWFSMLFSAGLGSGLLYWGTAEPITHFGSNPFALMDGLTAGSTAAATQAITVTIFHWGLHGWGLYVIAALAIGLSAYRFNHPLTFSSALIPLFGEKMMSGKLGTVVDLIALYGTVFGMATSVGLTVGSMNATLEPLLGIKITVYNQVAIILAVSVLGIFSAVSGVQKGIKRLSEFNIWLSLGLLTIIVVLGPTWYLLSSIPVNLVDYAVNVIPMGFWISDSKDGVAWQGAWSIFYWGWWLAWTPFVALFVARISRGRTIREFTLGVLLVPSLITIIWMSVFGGTALHQELVEPGVVSSVVADNYALGLIETIRGLQVPALETPILVLVGILLLTWLITSLDSATLVVCHILRMDHIPGMKVFWGFILGGVTCTLLLIGGITALQAASIIIGLPMAILVLLTLLSVVKMIFQFQSSAATGEELNRGST
jgi:choline/glycine/proline betaine transport protein